MSRLFRLARNRATIPCIATDTTRSPFNLRDEHLASRKQWGAYINLTTVVHRQTAAQAADHIARVRARLAEARRRSDQ